jgi:hypothetical protein
MPKVYETTLSSNYRVGDDGKWNGDKCPIPND